MGDIIFKYFYVYYLPNKGKRKRLYKTCMNKFINSYFRDVSLHNLGDNMFNIRVANPFTFPNIGQTVFLADQLRQERDTKSIILSSTRLPSRNGLSTLMFIIISRTSSLLRSMQRCHINIYV